MKCLQKLYSSPSWLVVSLCLLSTLFLTMTSTNSVSAVSDISVTYNANQSVSQWDEVFPSCTGDCFNQYSYLIVDGSYHNISSYAAFITFYIRFDGSFSNSIVISGSLPYSIYKLPFNGSPNNYLYFGQSYTFENDVTFTLTESYSSCPPAPSGSLSITENGTFDVTNYSEAVVDVPMQVVPGDYHDDLVDLKQSIILVPAVCLVIYFFYAIYKMIMGGVKR